MTIEQIKDYAHLAQLCMTSASDSLAKCDPNDTIPIAVWNTSVAAWGMSVLLCELMIEIKELNSHLVDHQK